MTAIGRNLRTTLTLIDAYPKELARAEMNGG